jgi:hypothetical protein
MTGEDGAPASNPHVRMLEAVPLCAGFRTAEHISSFSAFQPAHQRFIDHDHFLGYRLL